MIATPLRFQRTLGANPDQLGQLRADLCSWLDAHAVSPEDRDAVVLACSEIVANAMEHGLRGAEGVVDVCAEVSETAVTLRIRDGGQWRDPVSAGSRGRGLIIVDELMDEMSMVSDNGTTVRVRRNRSPTAR